MPHANSISLVLILFFFFILLNFPKFCPNWWHPVLSRKIHKVGDAMKTIRKVKSGETRLLQEWKLNALRKAIVEPCEAEEWRCSLSLNMATAEATVWREPLKYPRKITKKEGIVQLLGSFRSHDSCCHQNVTLLCVRLSDLRSFHVGHVAQNRRKVLSLAWHEWFSCKGREWKIVCCAFALSKISFDRLRQKVARKSALHVQHDYFSSFNQSYHWFVALSFLKLPHSKTRDDKTKEYIVYLVIRGIMQIRC